MCIAAHHRNACGPSRGRHLEASRACRPSCARMMLGGRARSARHLWCLADLLRPLNRHQMLSPTARHHQDVIKFDLWRRLCRSPCVSVSLTGGLCRSPVNHAIAALPGSFSVFNQKRQERNKTRAQRVWDARQRRPKVWRYALDILSRAERMRRLTEPRSSRARYRPPPAGSATASPIDSARGRW